MTTARFGLRSNGLRTLCLFAFLASCTFHEEPIRLDETATMLNISDPRAEKQLVAGFFHDEGPGRWTGRTFSAALKPPPTATRKGAVLVLRAGFPGPSVERLGGIQISASVNGVAVAPQKYSKPDEFRYIRDLPAR